MSSADAAAIGRAATETETAPTPRSRGSYVVVRSTCVLRTCKMHVLLSVWDKEIVPALAAPPSAPVGPTPHLLRLHMGPPVARRVVRRGAARLEIFFHRGSVKVSMSLPYVIF